MKRKLRMKLRIFKSVFLLSTSLTISSFSGIKTIREFNDYVDEYYYDALPHGVINEVEFEEYKFHIGNKYTNDELKQAIGIKINLLDGKDYSFLNEMENLERIIIYDYSTEPVLKNMNGKIFKKPLNIEINKMDDKVSFSKEKYQFLKNIPNIDSLSLFKSPNIESKFLENLKNVHNLKIEVGKTTSFNFQELLFLDSLFLDGDPYNVAMFISKNDLKQISKSKMIFKARNIDTLVKVINQIDTIIKKLNIDYNENDKEKMEKIVKYILTNSEYSKEIVKNINDLSKIDMNKYYDGGYLKGFLENDSQICGNYTAAITALFHAIGLESYNLFSNNHCWNMVKLDENYYYIDGTLLDNSYIKLDKNTNNEILISAEEAFSNSEYNSLRDDYKWFLQNPFTTINTIDILTDNKDELHMPNFIPADIVAFNKNYLDIAVINTDKEKEELNEIKKSEDKKLLLKNTSLTILSLIITKMFYEGLLLDIDKNYKIKRKIQENKKKRVK